MTSTISDVHASGAVAVTPVEANYAGLADRIDLLCAEAFEAGFDAAAVILSQMAGLLRALQPAVPELAAAT